MFTMNNTQPGMSVPIRQCLVISVLFGETHQLPSTLFSPELVSRVLVGVTGECPEKVMYSSATDILLLYGVDVDINRVKVQLESLASWICKPVHLSCARPPGKELRKFGVVGSIQPLSNSPPEGSMPKGDAAL